MGENRPSTSRGPPPQRQQTNFSRNSRQSYVTSSRGTEEAPRRPQFSLAGNGYSQAPSYIDPRYHDHNPRYGRQENKPVWGLAKPLPRMVRRAGDGSTLAVPNRKRQGLGRPTHTMQDGTEPSPQVARIPGQRAEELEEPAIRDDGDGQAGHVRSTSPKLTATSTRTSGRSGNAVVTTTSDRGAATEADMQYSSQSVPLDVGREDQDLTNRRASAARNPASWNSVERYGSPEKEKKDPFEQYIATHTDAEKFQEFGAVPSHMRPSTSRNASTRSSNLGRRRLSDVVEVDSVPSLSLQSTAKSDGITPEQIADPFQTNPHSPSSTASTDHVGLDLEAQIQELEDDYPLECEEQDYYDTAEAEGLRNFWSPIRDRFREPLAECLATFTATILAISTNLSILTSSSTAGSYSTGSLASGLGIMLGIYIAGGISGGHLNPAISIILSIFRGFPPRKALIYILAQCIGAYLAALVAFGIYRNAILILDSGALDAVGDGSGQAFLTGPKAWTGPAEAWANEFVATGILACAILALGDDQNSPPGAGMHALIVGLVVAVLGMAFGYPTGACLNPARDLGPRLAALTVGYGGNIFKSNDAWWLWGAWASTIGGAVTGSLLYDAFIFIGGESPVNYLGRKRKFRAAGKEKKKRLMRWWAYGSERSKVVSQAPVETEK